MARQGLDLGGNLVAQIEQRDGLTWIGLAGYVTEAADWKPLARLPGPLRMDLGGIERINSLGVRGWVHFIADCEATGLQIIVDRCSPVMTSQMSMIRNFMGTRTQVASLLVPYFCQSCNTDDLQLVELRPGAPVAVEGMSVCPKCRGQTVLDELPSMYSNLNL
ncbi:MAG: hypothetical protein WKG01_41505 [Kofleriaceae bacterium]